jgi:hypothetical protein
MTYLHAGRCHFPLACFGRCKVFAESLPRRSRRARWEKSPWWTKFNCVMGVVVTAAEPDADNDRPRF